MARSLYSDPHPSLPIPGIPARVASYGFWLGLCLCAWAAFAQDLAGLEDRPLNPSSLPKHLHAHNGVLYFVADDGIHGREIWRYVPAKAPEELGECSLVYDLMPGPENSNCEGFFSVGEYLYFMAEVPHTKRLPFLLRPDEDEPKTIRDDQGDFVSDPQFLGANSEYIYMTATDRREERMLYVLRHGETLADPVASLGRQWSWGRVSTMGNDGALYYFVGSTLFRMQDTTPVELVYLVSGGNLGVIGSITSLGDYVIFVGADEAHGRELWRTDGTPEGTVLVKDIAKGPDSSRITGFYEWRGELYFPADDGECGKELWKTDGTPEGTMLLKDHFLGPSDGDPHYFASTDQWLFYLAHDGTHGKELWRTGGTPESTVLVADLRPGPLGSNPWQLTAFNGELYFCADSAAYGQEIFISDGTAKGTRVLKDIVPGAGNSGPHNLTVLGDLLFFTCDDGIHGEELWVTDGTLEGTMLAADIYPIRLNPSSSPRDLTAVGERVFFTVYHQRWGKELWVSDGTFEGTRLVRDIAPGPAGSSPLNLTAVGDQLYFSAHTDTHGRELWVSDGTANGTRLVRDIRSGPEGSTPHHLCTDGEALFFAARDDTGNERIWRYMPFDASMVAAQAPEYAEAHIGGIFYLFEKVYAYLVDEDGDAHLCRVADEQGELELVIEHNSKVDAETLRKAVAQEFSTPDAETVALSKAQLARLIHPPCPHHKTGVTLEMGETLLCVLHIPGYGAELCRIERNPPGIRLVRDIFPGPASSSPSHLCEAGGRAYFSAEHPTEGPMLWMTDGSREGTGAIMGQAASVLSYMIPAYELVSLDDTLIVVSEPARPVVLERENIELRFIPLGTPIEEDLLLNIRQGNEGSWPQQLTRAGNQVFFTADDGIHGRELWVTAGTEASTRLVKDILAPGDLAPLVR